MTQFPRIHLNGSHPTHLLEPLNETIHLLNVARAELVANCAPHGRDYYTIGSDAISTAMSEHMARVQRIDDTIKELRAIAESVANQWAERTRVMQQVMIPGGKE